MCLIIYTDLCICANEFFSVLKCEFEDHGPFQSVDIEEDMERVQGEGSPICEGICSHNVSEHFIFYPTMRVCMGV